MGLVVLFSIGSMSDKYPAGFYPVSSTVPAQWTDAPGQPGVVQFNGLVYVKSNRHTGGTGKPNEEEVDGIRTWKLYTPAGQQAQVEKGFRFYWQHLHSVIPENGSPLVYDEDVYNHISSYFIRNTFAGTASENLHPASTASTDYRLLAPIPSGNILTTASGIFTVWHLTYTPAPSITQIYGLNGYSSDYPGTTPPNTPPTLLPVDLVVNKYIDCPHPVYVGKTYTGYAEKLEQTSSWVANGSGGYDYVSSAITITQVPITHTVTQQDFIDWVEGTTPYPLPTQTFSVTGGEDYWVGWGQVVLTDVSPSAND
jgi:hypothetical protein